MNMFEYLERAVQTQDGKVLFILLLITCAMVLDFISGTVAAKVSKDIKFESGKGINGILRKITSLFVMIYFIPVSILLPYETGVGFLYTLYIGYLIFEITSILENLEKMGINITLFRKFTHNLEKINDDEKEKETGGAKHGKNY